MAAYCQRLEREALEWLDRPTRRRQPGFNGSVESLVDCYQTAVGSPYQKLRQNTKRCYDGWCRALIKVLGTRQIESLVGQDLRDAYYKVMLPAAPGRPPRVRLARAVIRQMMQILLIYGSEKDFDGCQKLLDTLDRMELRVPDDVRTAWRQTRPRKVPMLYSHAEAVVTEALRRYHDNPKLLRWRSLALGVAAQFEFTLRQIDVIGEFIPVPPGPVPTDAIVRHGKLWHKGLRYEAFADGRLNVLTSKNATEAPFDVAEYPLFTTALATVPEAERRGPVVITDERVPIFSRFYVALYTDVAASCGVPKEVWNMRARHGGLTEGYNAIVEDDERASLADLRYHAQHSNLDTTLKNYVVGGIASTRRVARKRVARRNRREGDSPHANKTETGVSNT